MAGTATRADRLKAAHDKLQRAVTEVVSGDDWKRMLWNPPAVGPFGLRPWRATSLGVHDGWLV